MKFFAAIWLHLKSWPELYVVLPLVLLAIPGSGLAVYYLTGHSPKDSVSWLVDLSSRVVVASLVVIFVSFMREASGVWLTKVEQMENPLLAFQQALVKMFCIGVFVWLFTH